MKTLTSALIILSCFLITPRLLLAAPDENTIAQLFQNQADSIVMIGAVDQSEGHLGSGFIVRADGLIVTNYHLIQEAQKIIVKLRKNQGFKRVRIADFDAKKDIALLKVEAAGLNPVSLGNSSRMDIGDRVVSIGNPLGLESTISDGLISSKRQTNGGFKIFQISVPLSKGSSGGPLFNLQGEVIGITTASHNQGQNLNFAVPINYVKPLIRRFESGTEKNRKLMRIPRTSLLASSPKSFLEYTVQPKDTLFSLAKKFSTSVERIKKINRLRDEGIKTGQILKIPKTSWKPRTF